MKRTVRWCVVVALVLPVAVFAQKKKEPEYGGVPLSGLVKSLKSADAENRRYAAKAIGEIGPEAKTAAPAVAAAFKDKEGRVRVTAARSHWKITEDPKLAIPVLRDALKDKEFEVQSQAALVLGEVGAAAKDAVPALAAALKDSNQIVRDSAASALGKIGPTAKEAVPVLLDMYKIEDFKRAAGVALKAIDPAAAKGAGVE